MLAIEQICTPGFDFAKKTWKDGESAKTRLLTLHGI